MKLRRKYKSLEDTINLIIAQAKAPENINYAINRGFSTEPRELWSQLKPLLIYRNDPKGLELIQGISTLLTKRNYYGVSGMGDCDCFSCATLSIAFANKKPALITIVGNSKASHIYVQLQSKDGKWYSLDFTNEDYNVRRPYNKTQFIYVR
jgi:hypothetical protein